MKKITIIFLLIFTAVCSADNIAITLKNSSDIPDNFILTNVKNIIFPAEIAGIKLNIFNYSSGSEIYSMNKDKTFTVTEGNMKISCAVVIIFKNNRKKIFTVEIEAETDELLIKNLCTEIQDTIKNGS